MFVFSHGVVSCGAQYCPVYVGRFNFVRLKAELAAAKSELKEQTDRAQALESAKKRGEVEAEKRNRSLEELTEKSRRVLRYLVLVLEDVLMSLS